MSLPDPPLWPAPPDHPDADHETTPPARPDEHVVDEDRTLHAWVTFGVVAACVVFTFMQLQPSLILRDTLPNGGDMGAHVWTPAFLRDHLLPDWRLTGWTNDWYAGFPVLRFYMVPPMLAIVVLDLVLPYGVAFKLVAVSGALALPVAAWAFGRLAGLAFPAPPLLAVAAVAFLFHRDYSIYGGNLPSTLAGEFAFTISLCLALVYLGLVANGLRTGRHRAWAAVVVALCALTHVIPLIFAVVGAFVLLAVHPTRRGLAWLATSAPVGALLAMWWLLPFWWQRSHLNDMGWEKTLPPASAGWTERVGFWITFILPDEQRWLLDLPLVGPPLRLDLVILVLAAAVVLVAGRQRIGLALVTLLCIGSVAVVLVPQGRLWNARLTPFTHLLAYLIVALAVALVVRRAAAMVPLRFRDPLRVGGALAAVLAAAVVVALPLHQLPGGRTGSDGVYRWMGLESAEKSYIPGWARWNFTGYQGKEAWPEFEDVLLTMEGVGDDHGCGRAMWEYDRELDRYGTPMAMMLLPHFTDGCIASMEGLYFESATMTPFHFLNQSVLSTAPSRAQRGLPYRDSDIDLGVGQLQMMGVRYYLALSQEMIDAASRHPDLTELARSGPWVVYEVADAPLVESLTHLPAVLADPPRSNEDWIEATEDWFQAPIAWDLHLAADGPESWPRAASYGEATRVPVEPVEVSDVVLEDDRISFRVSEPGVPVLVKVSHFPNWEADGADGPWRVSPSFMVVVPTDEEVTLRYGTHPVELGGWLLTLVGVAGVVLLVRWGRLGTDEPAEADEPEAPDVEHGDDEGRDETTLDAPSRGRPDSPT
ncbi:6-pyruvoyl-tetrahydropterin synthase-related protein [Actinomarinicola tropica]|uniref:Membrane protein 6-pyruvoyl-tetrahydropterin synthase-related domain-containing protein n=1 Tax=Actinomarinicola tropica TaxID=2789776 RepID=A0A5Q2RRJ1_9ACTN|nr:6-pyruvoyl-tetrahydropterin synthase-related protein [Actinomarinicola tropica]QGG95805.1 hypothetical protein GH723_12240 [Actinomarinicola tropica]